MHRLLKSLHIQRVSALYICHLQGCHLQLYLHHYLNHKLSQLTRCYVTYVDEPHCHFVYGTTLCGDDLFSVWKMPYVW